MLPCVAMCPETDGLGRKSTEFLSGSALTRTFDHGEAAQKWGFWLRIGWADIMWMWIRRSMQYEVGDNKTSLYVDAATVRCFSMFRILLTCYWMVFKFI